MLDGAILAIISAIMGRVALFILLIVLGVAIRKAVRQPSRIGRIQIAMGAARDCYAMAIYCKVCLPKVRACSGY
jgi:hypothetical protein